MPFESKAQRRLFYAKASRGEIPQETVKRWEEETKKKGKRLPEKKAAMIKEAFWKGFEKKAAIGKSVKQILGAIKRKKPLAGV